MSKIRVKLIGHGEGTIRGVTEEEDRTSRSYVYDRLAGSMAPLTYPILGRPGEGPVDLPKACTELLDLIEHCRIDPNGRIDPEALVNVVVNPTFAGWVSEAYEAINRDILYRAQRSLFPHAELVNGMKVVSLVYRAIRVLTVGFEDIRKELYGLYGPDDYSHYTGFHRSLNRLLSLFYSDGQLGAITRRGHRLGRNTGIERLAEVEDRLRERPCPYAEEVGALLRMEASKVLRVSLEKNMYVEYLEGLTGITLPTDEEIASGQYGTGGSATDWGEIQKDKEREKKKRKVIKQIAKGKVEEERKKLEGIYKAAIRKLPYLLEILQAEPDATGCISLFRTEGHREHCLQEVADLANVLLRDIPNLNYRVLAGDARVKVENLDQIVDTMDLRRVVGDTLHIWSSNGEPWVSFRYPMVIMKDYLGIHWRLGPFAVHLGVKSHELRVFRWEEEDLEYSQTREGSKIVHPHQHAGEGSFCTGEMQAALSTSIDNGDWIGVYDVMTSLLHSYYRHGPIKMEGWNEDAYCDPEGSPIDRPLEELYAEVGGFYCNRCQGWFKESEDSWECEGCGKKYHRYCSDRCPLDIQDDPRGIAAGVSLPCHEYICPSCGDPGKCRCASHKGLTQEGYRKELMDRWRTEILHETTRRSIGQSERLSDHVYHDPRAITAHVNTAGGGFIE